MKKLISVLLAVLIALLPCAALAETETAWYELSAEDTVLTVRLPGNTKTGLTWSFEISDGNAIDLITHEIIEGESEGMAGTPTTYVASFMAPSDEEATAALIFRCCAEGADAPVYTRVLQLTVNAEHQITINSVQEIEPFALWCEYGDGGSFMTVRLPGEDWSFDIVDDDALELLTCENFEGGWVGSFCPTLNRAGFAEMVLTSADGLEQRAVTVFIDESGCLTVERVDVFTILNPVEAE